MALTGTCQLKHIISSQKILKTIVLLQPRLKNTEDGKQQEFTMSNHMYSNKFKKMDKFQLAQLLNIIEVAIK